jgi:hypothetical protein
LCLLIGAWSCGDSQAECFETAKAFCVACLPKRKRPGRTVQGFEKAVARLPMAALRAVAAGVRRRLAMLLELRVGGFIPLGCDGSRIECPRTAELEARLGQASKEHAAPTVWLTALVHLRLGVPWAWRWGKGTASERSHLISLLPLLPAAALVVTDAGYVGYELAKALIAAEASFLVRMSSTVTLFTERATPPEPFRDGEVLYWPGPAQKRGEPPLRVRLIRVRGRKKKGAEVWLLTNVLDAGRLPAATAAQMYRWRWENEGLFRTYKRTLAKVKLRSRSVRLAHREAESSLLALQVLLAQGARAMPRRATAAEAEAPRCSPRQVLLAIREELAALPRPRRRPSFRRRLAEARRERRRRRSAKVKRPWPRRKDHQPPMPPRILTLTAQQKARISRLERQAA